MRREENSFEVYLVRAVERAMKLQEVILRAVSRQITWWQAAEVIGSRPQSMRRRKCAVRGVRLRRAV